MSGPTLSRAVVSLRGERAPRGSTRGYLLHQAVADLFPDREDRGYLFRETRPRPGGAELLVLSAAPPRPLDEIPVRPWGGAVHVESKPFVPALSAGMRLDFELRANATRVVTQPDGRKRREDVWNAIFRANRDDPRSPAQAYREWLARRLDDAAEILDMGVVGRGEVCVSRGDPQLRDPRDRRIRFVAADLAGTLRVRDPARLLESVVAGIGRGKAFGCGLLCLSRPGSLLPHRTRGAATPD